MNRARWLFLLMFCAVLGVAGEAQLPYTACGNLKELVPAFAASPYMRVRAFTAFSSGLYLVVGDGTTGSANVQIVRTDKNCKNPQVTWIGNGFTDQVSVDADGNLVGVLIWRGNRVRMLFRLDARANRMDTMELPPQDAVMSVLPFASGLLRLRLDGDLNWLNSTYTGSATLPSFPRLPASGLTRLEMAEDSRILFIDKRTANVTVVNLHDGTTTDRQLPSIHNSNPKTLAIFATASDRERGHAAVALSNYRLEDGVPVVLTDGGADVIRTMRIKTPYDAGIRRNPGLIGLNGNSLYTVTRDGWIYRYDLEGGLFAARQ